MRVAKPTEALESLVGSYDRHRAGNIVSAEFEVVIATAQMITNQIDKAEGSLTNARALGFATGSTALEGEIHFVAAMVAWKDGRIAHGRNFIDSILRLEEPCDASIDAFKAPHIFPLPYWRARAFEIESRMSSSDEDAQASSYISSLLEFERAPGSDRFIEASVLYNATVLLRETGNCQLRDTLVERAANFPWTDGLAFFEFFVYHNFGARSAYEGDHISALRNYRRSAEVAPSTALKLLALLDRCRLIFDLGESLSATEELDYALKLSRQVDWSKTTSYERRALLALGSLLAPFDVQQARAAFNRYHSTSTAVWTAVTPEEAKQSRAISCHAESRILFAEGEPKRGILALLDAHCNSAEIGFNRLKAITALELWQHTGEAQYLDVASREALQYRDSILARRMRTLMGQASRT